MKKTFLLLAIASLFAFAGCEREDDIVPIDPITPDVTVAHGFSVSESQQVSFAPGNLTYDSVSGYGFASRQYALGGHFGWGTGSNPSLVCTDNSDYPAFDDWGNHIDGGWRTLTRAEWNYVISGRADADSKCGAATVCGVHGIVLLPDEWEGEAINAGFVGNDNWDMNVYDTVSWTNMETAGAVFLPAAGIRVLPVTKGKVLTVIGINAVGHYWSSTPYSSASNAYSMYFDNKDVVISDFVRRYGQSVRLVRDIEN